MLQTVRIDCSIYENLKLRREEKEKGVLEIALLIYINSATRTALPLSLQFVTSRVDP